MHSIIKTLSLGLALTVAFPAFVGTASATDKEAAVKIDRKKTAMHLSQHQTYPATRAQLLASCKNLVDFSDAEKGWFADHLPEGTYNSADEVMKVLFKK
jgi:hypothetical protein